MEFHNNVTQQAAWDELVHKLSSWKNLAFAYLKSIKDAEPYSEELFNAMKSASNNFFTHIHNHILHMTTLTTYPPLVTPPVTPSVLYIGFGATAFSYYPADYMTDSCAL